MALCKYTFRIPCEKTPRSRDKQTCTWTRCPWKFQRGQGCPFCSSPVGNVFLLWFWELHLFSLPRNGYTSHFLIWKIWLQLPYVGGLNFKLLDANNDFEKTSKSGSSLSMHEMPYWHRLLSLIPEDSDSGFVRCCTKPGKTETGELSRMISPSVGRGGFRCFYF